MSEDINQKIQQLIRFQQGDNAMLAIQLMQSQLGLSFSEAFKKLIIPECLQKSIAFSDGESYLIEVLDYTIHLAVYDRWAPALDYPYVAVDRKVYHKGAELKAYRAFLRHDFYESKGKQDRFNLIFEVNFLTKGLEELFSQS